jgi:hypothetical protein
VAHSDDFDWKKWYDLREIVTDAASGSYSHLADSYRGDPIANAAIAYLSDRNETTINAAAKELAKMTPGVDPSVAEDHYWLVLEKS